jgi:FtsH-binding integral membrane protein
MKRIWIPQAIAGIMLAWALNPANPYGYYLILRIVCCAVCTYLALASADAGKTQWTWTLGVLAVIYNPIIQVHLNRGIWSVINIVTIVIFALSVLRLERKER